MIGYNHFAITAAIQTSDAFIEDEQAGALTTDEL